MALAFARPLLVALVVAGCIQTTHPLPEITFAHAPVIALNVARLDIQSNYQSPGAAPNVEHLFPTRIDEAMRRWAQQRLRAMGSTGSVRFTVVNAAATEEVLPVKSGFVGAFTTEFDRRYTATAEATIEILDDGGALLSGVNVRVTRSRDFHEGATLEERNLFWQELTKAVMEEFDAQAERAIRRTMNAYVL